MSLRRLSATFPLLLLVAACASGPALRAPPRTADLPPPSYAGYPMDPASLAKRDADEDEDDEGEREREERATAVSAEENLRRESDENGPPTAAQILRAQEQRRALVAAAAPSQEKSAGLQPSMWQALGPSNVGGRVRSLAFDPSAPLRLLAGTASGGLWISPDAGLTWRANHDFLPNLSITTLAFDRTNPAIVYLGTGEASQGLVGLGAFKSLDGGNTWQFLAATNVDANPDWRFVNRIAVHPSQSSILLAGVTHSSRQSGAIYRSIDAGATWVRVSTLKALDIAFDPNNPSNALAGLDNGTLAYSRDAGATWSSTARLIETPSGARNTARAEIAFARSQPGVVYASIDNNSGQVWRSEDSGASWSVLSTPQHLAKQGDYDNAIWVDPTDANHVVVAGLDIYQSRDGGNTFNKVSDWRIAPGSAHADHHALVSPPNFGPSNALLYDGNDGGIYRSLNIYAVAAGGWANMNNGLAVTQFYSGAGPAAAGGRIVGGTQDNYSQVLTGGLWRRFGGGDGGYVAVDPASDSILYGEYVYAAVRRSFDGGESDNFICAGITEAYHPDDGPQPCGTETTQKANFTAPFILDPNNASRLLVGANSLWVTDNARAATVSWRAIKPPSPATDNFISAVSVAPGNSNAIWVGHNNGEVYRSLDGNGAAPSWTRIGAGVFPSRQVQRVTLDRGNPNRVIVAFTGFVANNVWQSLDGGVTWASITANLPFVPVFDVKRHASNPDWLYAATSVGVFTSENGGISWSTTNEGPANIRVRELFWIDDATLGAATYGRGMWKVSVSGGGPANYQDLWWAGAAENGWGMSLTQHGATIFGAFYIYDAQGNPSWFVLPGGTWNAGYTAYSGPIYIPSGSWFGNYDVGRFIPGASVGNATLTFASAGTATLDYVINGVPGRKSIQRQLFGPPDATPVATYGDLWWGGTTQNGWGVAISQQYRNLFAVWYTYDVNGRTVWYVMPAGSWTAANTYSGAAYRTTGSPWIGSTYNPAALNAQPVGTVTFTFTDLDNGVMSYTIEGVTGSKPIVRQPF